MQPLSLRGMGVALATPFKSDFSVDFPALARLVDYQIAGGASYLVVLATTSEAVTLTCPSGPRWRGLWPNGWPGACR